MKRKVNGLVAVVQTHSRMAAIGSMRLETTATLELKVYKGLYGVVAQLNNQLKYREN